MRNRALAVLALVALVAASGAAALDRAAVAKKPDAIKKKLNRAKKGRLKAFRSCRALARYGRRHVSRGVGAQPPPVVGLPGPPQQRGFGEGAPGAAPVGEDQGSSRTNIQEAGVDEPDVAKVRGTHLFAVAGNQVHAVDVGGEAPRRLSSLPVEGFGHELLRFRDRLLVFSRFSGPEPEPLPRPQSAQSPIAPGADSTLLTEIDVSDPAAMRIVRTEEVPGGFLSARRRGRTVRVAIAATPRAVYDESVRSRVAGWVPRRVVENARSGRRRGRPVTACRRVRRTAAFSGLQMLTILTVDLSKGLPAVDSDALMSGGEIVYGSQGSFYVATQRWTPEPAGPEREPPRTFTAIHRFDASEPGVTAYRSSGVVRGYLLNQFSMSEHEGVLRVASTDTPVWWGAGEREESQSFVTTLDERSGALVELGRVGGLGQGERIYAVRFIDDAGFVVTFRQVDPLYTVDLSQPREPRVLGELKILGYSAYLHPIAADLLLGVGQDASEEGRLRGAQLSLFDVSDLRAPKRLHQRDLGEYSSSDVEYDHHAFLWWQPENLAVLPLQGRSFTGAVGFKVGRSSGIAEAGRASHETSDYTAPVRRARVIRGRLFTLSDEGVEQDSLTNLAEEAWLPLPAR